MLLPSPDVNWEEAADPISFPRLARLLPSALALLAGAGLAPRLEAQEATGLDLYRPHLTVSVTGIPRAETDSLGGQFGSFGGFLDGTFPAGAAGRVRFFGRLRLGADSADFGFLHEKRTLYSAHAGLTAWLGSGGRDSFLVSLGPSIAEDEHTIGSPRLRFAGAALGVHRSSPQLFLDYGLIYSYAYGRGRLLPAFGVRWEPERGWVVSALLPVAVSVRRRVGPTASVGLLAAPMGERVRFQNAGEFPGQPSIVNLRLRQYRIAAEAVFRAWRQAALSLEAGALVARKISFANNDDDFVESSLKSAPYGRLSVRLNFGAQP
jgi:Domain of unknown function (DUF6268)